MEVDQAMKAVSSFLMTCLIIAVGTLLVFQGLNFISHKKEPVRTQQDTEKTLSIHLLAVGDSLTKGVGDSTKNGGYVSLVANQLRETPGVEDVTTKNYGITGERSDEILKRIQEQKELQTDIEEADMIVLTAGGNDLIETFKKEKLNINEESFVKPEEKYKENLSTILKTITKRNPEAQIYVFGLYNPYEAVFPEITEMKTILLKWNEDTQKIAKENKATYLSLSAIFNGDEQSIMSKKNYAAEEIDTSTLLYEADLFHPNDKGYQLIADELYRAIVDQKNNPLNR